LKLLFKNIALQKLKFILLIISILFFKKSVAQFPEFNFRYYTVKDGLSNSEVYCFTQDKQGFIWLGTSNGLNRFDGINFKTFRNVPFKENQILDGNYRHLMVDKTGLIWIATSHNGVSVYDSKTNQFKNFIYSENESTTIGDGASFRIIEDKEGLIWFAHYFNGVSFYDKQTKKFTRFRKKDGLTDDATLNIYETKDGKILIGTANGGLNIYNKKTKKITSINTSNSNLPTNLINGIAEDNSGLWWLATDKGIVKYNPKNSDCKLFNVANNKVLKTDLFFNVSKNKAGLLFFNSLNGFYAINPQTEELKAYFLNENKELKNGWNSNTNSFFDNEDNLWIQFANGFCFAPNNNSALEKIERIDNTISQKNSFYEYLLHDTLWAFAHDRIICKDLISKKVNELIFPKSILNEIKDYDWEFAETNGDYMAISSVAGGVIMFDKTKSVFQLLPKMPDGRAFAIVNRYSDFVDSKSNFWGVDSKLGIVKFNFELKRWEVFKPFNVELHHQYYFFSTRFLEDRNHNVWIANPYFTLLKYNLNTKKTEQFTHQPKDEFSISFTIPQSIYEDRKGRIWFGGYGNSIDLYNNKTNQFIHFVKNDAFENIVKNITEDNDGNLWCFQQQSIVKFHVPNAIDYSKPFQNDFNYTVYGTMNGYLGYYFGNNFVFKTSDNKLYFDNKEGFYKIDINKIQTNNQQPKVFFTEFKVNNTPIETFENTSLLFTKKINLSHDENSIEISFAALSYAYAENNLYAYQLVGVDKDWQYTDSKHLSAKYSLLPPGDYDFKLKAANSDGIWMQEPQKIKIIIHSAFWQTWWFKMLVVIIFLLLVYVIYRYRLKQIYKMEKIRNKISRDLHDDIGATISAINISSKMLQRKLNDETQANKIVQNIQEDIKYVGESLDDIVWSINPENNDWQSLTSRMRRYASEILENNHIEYEIKFPEKLINKMMDADKLKDFYLIFKEAVNNAAKHSKAQFVKIELQEEKHLILMVEDNGKGFDIKLPTNRNGVSNMNKRAELINADLEINSKLNIGTTVKLTLK
jgi:ligand-binding sensor domain-containing protein/two-component sensor histidine kinase